MSKDIDLTGLPNTINRTSLVEKFWDESKWDEIFPDTDRCCNISLENAVTTGKFFLNKYIQGDIGGSHVDDMLLVLIGGMQPKGTNMALFESFLNGNGFKPATGNEGTWTSLTDPLIGKAGYFQDGEHLTASAGIDAYSPEQVALKNTASTLSPFDSPGKSSDLSSQQEIKIVADDINRFYRTMIGYSASKDQSEVLRFVNVNAWIALILIRGVVRTKSSVANFIINRGTAAYNSLFGDDMTLQIVPPHDTFITQFQSSLQKGTTGASKVIKHLLHVYKASIESKAGKTPISAILRSGCLLHMEHNGMMPIKTLLSCVVLTKYMIPVFLTKVAWRCFEPTIRLLATLLRDYYQPGGISLFPWCRLIDDNYHTSLASSNNKSWLLLTYHMIETLDTNQQGDIWSQAPFNGKPNIPDKIIKLVETIRKDLEELDDTSLIKGSIDVKGVTVSSPTIKFGS